MGRGFSQKKGEDYDEVFVLVVELNHALYGLKQASRALYSRIDVYMTRLGFYKSVVDPNNYIKVVKGEPVIMLLYVDDVFLTGVEHLISQCKRDLASEFDMNDIGLMH